MTIFKKRLFILTSATLFALFVAIGLNWEALVTEYKLWRDFKSLGLNEQGYPEYEHLKSGIVMVLLPGGEFLMGSPEDEPGRDENEHRHKVNVTPFLIAKYEVSQEVWWNVMGSAPSHFEGPNLPVDSVSWNDCYGDDESFCKLVGLSLPTEAQWEYSCRAGTQTPFSFGDKISVKTVNYQEVDTLKSKGIVIFGKQTVPIDYYPPNNFGLHSMHGNVFEWCLDIYSKDQNALKINNPDPKSHNRVRRGGFYRSFAKSCRSAFRHGEDGRYDSVYAGFRPVYNLTP